MKTGIRLAAVLTLAAAAFSASAASFKAGFEQGQVIIYASSEVQERCNARIKYSYQIDGKWQDDTLKCEGVVLPRNKMKFCASNSAIDPDNIRLQPAVQGTCAK